MIDCGRMGPACNCWRPGADPALALMSCALVRHCESDFLFALPVRAAMGSYDQQGHTNDDQGPSTALLTRGKPHQEALHIDWVCSLDGRPAMNFCARLAHFRARWCFRPAQFSSRRQFRQSLRPGPARELIKAAGVALSGAGRGPVASKSALAAGSMARQLSEPIRSELSRIDSADRQMWLRCLWVLFVTIVRIVSAFVTSSSRYVSPHSETGARLLMTKRC